MILFLPGINSIERGKIAFDWSFRCLSMKDTFLKRGDITKSRAGMGERSRLCYSDFLIPLLREVHNCFPALWS